MIRAIPVVLLIVAPMLSSAIKAQGHFVPMGHKEVDADGKLWYTTSGNSRSLVNKRNTPSIPRQGRNYEDDQINNQEQVDLHKGEFCVDVSTYGPVEYDHVPVEVCDSTFAKQCEDRYEEVNTRKKSKYPCLNGHIPTLRTSYIAPHIYDPLYESF